jgi:hypothetical protein
LRVVSRYPSSNPMNPNAPVKCQRGSPKADKATFHHRRPMVRPHFVNANWLAGYHLHWSLGDPRGWFLSRWFDGLTTGGFDKLTTGGVRQASPQAELELGIVGDRYHQSVRSICLAGLLATRSNALRLVFENVLDPRESSVIAETRESDSNSFRRSSERRASQATRLLINVGSRFGDRRIEWACNHFMRRW